MRSVSDTARVFNVIAGIDPADPATGVYRNHKVDDYTANLSLEGLYGARLGVLRQIYDVKTADKQVLAVFGQALKDLELAGAVVIDPVAIPDFAELVKATGFCGRFRYDINNYLKTLGKNAKVKSLQDVVDQENFRPQNSGAMKWAMTVAANVKPDEQDPPCIDVAGDPRRQALLNAVVATMDSLKLDALVYPTWSNPPRRIGDSESPHGNNSPVIAPHSGQPAITVPMGYADNKLPLGLQLLGRPFSEATLFQYAYAYEQATRHRKPPRLFP